MPITSNTSSRFLTAIGPVEWNLQSYLLVGLLGMSSMTARNVCLFDFVKMKNSK